MDPSSRVEGLSLTPTVDRQTPKASFGDVLHSSLTGFASASGAVLRAVPGGPLLSAAVSSVQSLAGVSGLSGAGPQAVVPTRGASASPGAEGPAGGDAWSLLGAQDSMSQKYLALQMEMQRESREYNAVSNIMKVRHESAKAAINNLR